MSEERFEWQLDDVEFEDGPEPTPPLFSGKRSQRSLQLPVGQVEARSAPFVDLDVTKNGRHFDGYAAIYGEEADLGQFIEVIVPPAFRNALAATGNLPMLWDHNPGMPPFATTRAGTLTVQEDRRGLRVQAEIDERHILGPTMMSMAERGELHGMSFGFVTDHRDNKVSQRNGKLLRTITGFKRLLDVSPTWNPAYAGTSAELRSLSTLSAPALVPEQSLDGEPQSAEGGPELQEDAAVTERVCDCPEGECTCEPVDEAATSEVAEERDAGVTPMDEVAARRRRLLMMGLTLPKDDITRLMGPDAPETERRRHSVNVDEILSYPRETWSGEEHRAVHDRLRKVQTELLRIAGNAERQGRTLNAEEASEFDTLQGEFQRLRAA